MGGNNEQDILEILKTELWFLEIGGYSMRSSWGPQFIFEDSPTCINYDRKEDPRPCTECILMNFVPPEHRSEKIPCRHIPLNSLGETLDSLYKDSLYRYGNPQEVEEAVGKWLRATIDRLEKERRAPATKR